MLRAERDSGSKHGELINNVIKEGKIVPVAITCRLIQAAMSRSTDKNKFLIDGFPRNEDNLTGWIREVGDQVDLGCVLHFVVDEKAMTERILKRANSSGRNDDNLETLKKRFKQYKEEQLPVISKFGEQGKVVTINGMQPPELVFQDVKQALE